MCDYSLHVFPNRLAVSGEELVVHRFGGTSMGLASPRDIQCAMPRGQCGRWNRIKEWFKTQWQQREEIPAVCVPPGARLMLSDIPKTLQRELGVGPIEEVTFVETSAEVNTYRDGVRFGNGRQILLQALRTGQRVMVLSVELEERQELKGSRRWPEVQIH
jgi:hypothetical protein